MGMEPLSAQPFEVGSTVNAGNVNMNMKTTCGITQLANDHDLLSSVQHVSIKMFSQYCQSFYNSSLIITNSSASLDQDKIMGYAMSNDYKVSQGKIVMEVLDRIGAMRAAAQSCCESNSAEVRSCGQKTLDKLRNEHELTAECHRDLLEECGLLYVDRFLGQHPSEPEDLVSYEQYTQIRDSIRRRSHKLAMLQRQSSLYELLSDIEGASCCHGKTTNGNSISLTQLKHVKHAIATTEQFVRKYRRNIGCHSFLAGLHRLIHMQLHSKSNNDVVQWTFLGSVLTEACHSNDEGDTEAYARDAPNCYFHSYHG
jgi:hypothetical protein